MIFHILPVKHRSEIRCFIFNIPYMRSHQSKTCFFVKSRQYIKTAVLLVCTAVFQSKIFRTSAALVSGLTLGITLIILPVSSITKVVRTMPRNDLPYSSLGRHTPYASIACRSGSESRMKGSLYFSANFACETTLSLLMPMITAFFSSNSLYAEPNAHACRVQPGVLSFG